MDKKTLLPVVSIALLSCIALMLTVIGGLYTYNTFVSDAQPVSAQAGNGGTDKGPDWSVTPVTTGGDKQHLVIVRRVDNPYDVGEQAMQMAVYEVTGNNSRANLWLVGSRLIEYDFKIPNLSDKQTRNGYEPLEVKEAVDDAEAARKKAEEGGRRGR